MRVLWEWLHLTSYSDSGLSWLLISSLIKRQTVNVGFWWPNSERFPARGSRPLYFLSYRSTSQSKTFLKLWNWNSTREHSQKSFWCKYSARSERKGNVSLSPDNWKYALRRLVLNYMQLNFVICSENCKISQKSIYPYMNEGFLHMVKNEKYENT